MLVVAFSMLIGCFPNCYDIPVQVYSAGASLKYDEYMYDHKFIQNDTLYSLEKDLRLNEFDRKYFESHVYKKTT